MVFIQKQYKQCEEKFKGVSIVQRRFLCSNICTLVHSCICVIYHATTPGKLSHCFQLMVVWRVAPSLLRFEYGRSTYFEQRAPQDVSFETETTKIFG